MTENNKETAVSKTSKSRAGTPKGSSAATTATHSTGKSNSAKSKTSGRSTTSDRSQSTSSKNTRSTATPQQAKRPTPSNQSKKKTAKRKRKKKLKKQVKNFIKIYKIPIILTALLLTVTAILAGVIVYQNIQKKNAERIDLVEAIVDTACEEFSVPKPIVMAIIKTESDFQIYAESDANARGLMQITKITLKDINQRRGTDYEFGQMFVPEINIECGVYYLSYLYERFGDYEIAFAAYNAGPTIVSEWLKDPKYSSNGKLTDIPFPETARYVEKVCQYWNDYKEIYQ